MGYSITYNSGTTTPFGTFKQGPITMALKPDEYTVSSGFTWYANAEYTNDSYLIISDTYSQGWSTQTEAKPTIWRSETGTTESFVSLVNQLPDVNGVTGFTDSGSAMEYLQGTGKYFVSKDEYLAIVTDGLVLNLDAGWYPSYSGSGTTWKDLSGSNNGTLTNGPTFNSDNSGSIVFDGVNDYVDLGNNSSLSSIGGTSNITVSGWVYYNAYGGGGQPYSVITIKGFPWTWLLENPGNTFRFRIVAGGSDVSVIDTSNHLLNTWYNVVGTYDGFNMKIYINGVIKNTKQQSGVLATNNITAKVGTYQGGNYNLNGKISGINIYNRTLTASEVLQNYNATKGRFGL